MMSSIKKKATPTNDLDAEEKALEKQMEELRRKKARRELLSKMADLRNKRTIELQKENQRLQECIDTMKEKIAANKAEISATNRGQHDEMLLELELNNLSTIPEVAKATPVFNHPNNTNYVMAEAIPQGCEKNTETEAEPPSTPSTKRNRELKPRPKGDELFGCFLTSKFLRLRYTPVSVFYAYLDVQSKYIAISQNGKVSVDYKDCKFYEGDNIQIKKTLNAWVETARDDWMKTSSSKNPYDVIDYLHEDGTYLSIRDLMKDTVIP